MPRVYKFLHHLQPSLDNRFQFLKLPGTVWGVRKIMPKLTCLLGIALLLAAPTPPD
ncbi:MAG TPA: hypothetical protein VJQ50_05610 [Terriglobales bacterium]|nr:hypothetical protein [Terriglobales bacterium]